MFNKANLKTFQTEADAKESPQIFKEIGAELRKRRELLSLHLADVERNTHVKAHYLEALELGAGCQGGGRRRS